MVVSPCFFCFGCHVLLEQVIIPCWNWSHPARRSVTPWSQFPTRSILLHEIKSLLSSLSSTSLSYTRRGSSWRTPPTVLPKAVSIAILSSLTMSCKSHNLINSQPQARTRQGISLVTSATTSKDMANYLSFLSVALNRVWCSTISQ